MKKIPPRLIQNAVGLAVFTSMRSGLWTSGSGGSGILIARKTDGTWSPPSGLVLQTASLGFVIGVDIYDCVLIINNFTVLEAFARSKLTLGTDVMLSRGPLVSLGLLENDVTWTDLSDSAITYVKAKGQCSEVKLEGTVLQERTDENERFYGMTLGVAKILSGDINQSLPQVRPLTEVLKAAEGRVDYDVALVESLSAQPAPGDTMIEPSGTPLSSPDFGLPSTRDPDPFGVLALEMAGIGIREAGTHLRPESTVFEYHPSPTSPAFPRIKRTSVDTFRSRSNRGSYMSTRTAVTEKSVTTDACTQTVSTTPETTPTHSQSQSEDGNHHHPGEVPDAKEPIDVDYTRIDISSLRMLSNFPDLEEELPDASPMKDDTVLSSEPGEKKARSSSPTPSLRLRPSSPPVIDGNEIIGDADGEDGDDGVCVLDGDDMGDDGSDFDDDDDELDGDEEAVVFEVATAQAPTRMAMAGTQIVQAKGAVVTIPKRVPPPLPLRSPARSSRGQMPDIVAIVSSPLRQEFDPLETSGLVTPRAPETLEPAIDVVEKEVSHPQDNTAKVNDLAGLTNPVQPFGDSEPILAPAFQERSAERSSTILHASSTEEQAKLDSGHTATVSAA